jgi:hypothetical protein
MCVREAATPKVIVEAIIPTTPTTERRSQMVLQDRPLNRGRPEGNVARRLSDEGTSTERSQSPDIERRVIGLAERNAILVLALVVLPRT